MSQKSTAIKRTRVCVLCVVNHNFFGANFFYFFAVRAKKLQRISASG